MTRPARTAVGLLVATAGLLFFALAHARFASLHNRTYDLALYTRIAWGFVHAEWWEPILGANVLGLHLSLVLVPLGFLGALFGTPTVLLVAQAAAVALAAVPFARMGARRFGTLGAVAAGAGWLVQPNLLHVATYEMHPGTLAVLPLACALDALDRRDGRAFLGAVLATLACREDLGLLTALLGALAFATEPSLRRPARTAILVSVGWVLLFVAVLHPLFRPAQGSMEAHFGKWGSSLPEMLGTFVTEPARVLAHLAEPRRLTYLPRVLAPFALLPLLAPRWLLPALPIVGVALLSDFPTTTNLDSHYLTPALPFLMAAAIDGAARLRAWAERGTRRRAVPALATVAYAGALALAPVHPGVPEPAAFRDDARTEAGRRILALLPEDASVQAPDFLLPHLAERSVVHRAPPPERETDFVILDAWHRVRWAGQETLLRTTEEPVVRAWLARGDHGLVAAEGTLLLLARGADPRGGVTTRYRLGRTSAARGDRRLTACLSVRTARRVASDRVELELVASGPCPSDLALRLDGRVDLLFDGGLSPAHLRAGDRLRSVHALAPGAEVVALSVLRASGARPLPEDPERVEVPVRAR